MGTVLYTLIWCTISFAALASAQSVRVLAVVRNTSSDQGKGQETCDELVATLRDTAETINEPDFMPFAVALDVVKWLEACLKRDLDRTRHAEVNTGHGVHRRHDDQRLVASLSNIEQWAREVSATLLKSTGHYRHAESVEAPLSFIKESPRGLDSSSATTNRRSLGS